MTSLRTIPIPVLLLLSFLAAAASGQSLKVLTFNVWSGLDYKGTISVGEYETEEVRAERRRLMIETLRRLEPDVIALQEVNPVYEIADTIADALGYDRIFLRSEAGLKIGGAGIPTNLDEGTVILAKKELQLAWLDNIDLSSGFGVSGNTFAFHFAERSDALVGRILKDSVGIVVVCVHLMAPVPDRPETRRMLREIMAERGVKDTATYLRKLEQHAREREIQVKELVSRLKEEYPQSPLLLMGDLNADPSSSELRFLTEENGFLDAAGRMSDSDMITWDPEGNPNVGYSTGQNAQDDDRADPLEVLSERYDRAPRRIDYVLLSPHFGASAVVRVDRVFDTPVEGVFASDHYGLMATIDLSSLEDHRSDFDAPTSVNPSSSYDILPIAAYDTDVGFGIGLKSFFLNYLGQSESVDVTLFASTKGERLVRVVFSMPDFELRQGTVYPISFDLVVDYDKYLANTFFGVGNASSADDRETYTKEPLEISGLFGRGFSSRFVAQAGVKFRTVRNFNFADTSLFARTPPSLNQGRSNSFTLVASARYDSRDSYVNPSHGNVAQLDFEYGRKGTISDFDMTKAKVSLMGYRPFLFPRATLALRVMGQLADGDELPVHTLPSLGGGGTLRGYPRDRFLDKVLLLTNLELRYPIVYRISGIVGLDAGRVWNKVSDVNLSAWPWSGVVGLRFHLDTFVARADLGISKEFTGFYLDFGHLF